MKILLCEDEKSLNKAIVTMLGLSGYEVDSAHDGEIAWELLKNNSYDAVVMDIMMPKKDGISLIKEVRAAGNNVPCIMLTAKSEIDDKVLGLQCGANDYLTKPFAFKELIARIEVLTRSTNSNILSYRDITLDKANLEIKTQKGSLRLAMREFDMFEMLVNSPNGKIPAARFVEKVWRGESDVDKTIVSVYISYLQKKLALLGSEVSIGADEKEGYFLEG